MSSPATVPGLPAADRAWTLLIGGHPAPARSGRYYTDESPVTEQAIAAVPDGGADDVDAAVRAAVPAAAQ